MKSSLANPSSGAATGAKASLDTIQAQYPSTSDINHLQATLSSLRAGGSFYYGINNEPTAAVS